MVYMPLSYISIAYFKTLDSLIIISVIQRKIVVFISKFENEFSLNDPLVFKLEWKTSLNQHFWTFYCTK